LKVSLLHNDALLVSTDLLRSACKYTWGLLQPPDPPSNHYWGGTRDRSKPASTMVSNDTCLEVQESMLSVAKSFWKRTIHRQKPKIS